MKSGHRLQFLLFVLALGLLAAGSLPALAALNSAGYWSPIPEHGAGRANHALVWTGSSMIYWGGWQLSFPLLASGGESYDPRSGAWTPITTTNAPTGGGGPLALWTGSEVIVWGGGDGITTFDTGGRYQPLSGTWTTMTTTGAPQGRAYTPAFWTGSEMIFYGGMHALHQYLTDGARYNPQSDQWTPLAQNGAPGSRSGSSVVWTGSQLLVWGGRAENGSPTPGSFLNDGARYDLASDTWTPITTTLAPAPRANHAAVWTGQVLIVWSGEDGSGLLTDGGIYDPATDTWSALPAGLPGAPAARSSAFAAWTGRQMLVYGGGDGSQEIKDGALFDPQTSSWEPLAGSSALLEVTNPAAVWTGRQLLLWGSKYLSYRNYTGIGAAWALPWSTYLPVVKMQAR
jgi:N-acetylneuraminic acid mutarotase